ncbi:methylene-tetrahydrofolate reductase C terminal [Desulfuromonas soudanensis]|uniref:Methylene-tetrahydrofolate reductase C terminal n=1 Tax=Desulfuromonas soudanensis TaxID=1603606 RepID=A0A0M5IRV7_9BACT|nr:methylenetetrahydrofolate reductase C-terminal domain-containing protein [Desulfuromonas soudanensis]ALC17211.1 methylene-tetrahydrofolate reductase C terminal [Desulfuromonas soudanensis]
MIISEQKSKEELLLALDGCKRLFLVGCAACATACKSGGEEEVFRMQEWLTSLGCEVTGSLIIEEACHIMRAGRDLRQHRPAVEEADVLLVLACGAGIQSVSSSTDKRVIGGLNSLFLGNIRRFGQYEEKCSLCGDCILNETAGICPVTNCAKGLLNGPCGGMEEGRCEADRDKECAWNEIYQRLKKQGRPGVFARTVPPKNWGKVLKPGRHRIKP